MVYRREGKESLTTYTQKAIATLDVGVFGGVITFMSEKNELYQVYMKPFHIKYLA